jgi:hypothetical protein
MRNGMGCRIKSANDDELRPGLNTPTVVTRLDRVTHSIGPSPRRAGTAWVAPAYRPPDLASPAI